MGQLELAWAAGFFDGEGSTKKVSYHYRTKKGIVRKPTKNISMAVSQCDLSPLKRFRSAVGGLGRINGPYQYGTNKRPYWVWSASCKAAKAVFSVLKRHLCSIKKRQYRQVSQELMSVSSRKKGWSHDER